MKIGFLASHNGSNMQAIIDACRNRTLDATPVVVISNNADSGALARAKRENIPHYHLSAKTHATGDSLDRAILETLLRHAVDVVVLAGYMKKLGPLTLRRFAGAILNIHPALLPKFGGRGMYGIHVHEAVLAAGEKETGVTVHLVEEEYDSGPVLAQIRVSVMPEDTVQILGERVLRHEHALYQEVLRRILNGEVIIPGYTKEFSSCNIQRLCGWPVPLAPEK
jgi:phosphoribosylglycinamide formyltransferase 1